MKNTSTLGRIVTGCLGAGLGLALLLVLVGPAAGGKEHVVTGTVLLVWASSWASLALASVRANQPQRWAVMPAVFFAVSGAGLLVCAPGHSMLNALGWVWPPLLLAVLARTAVLANRGLRSRARTRVVYPWLAVCALCAIGGSYQTIGDSLDRRAHPAPGRLVDVGGHRLHLQCSGAGTPTVVLESGLGETGGYWGWISPAVAQTTTVCVYDRAGRGWSDAAPAPQDGVGVATDLHTLLQRAGVSGPFVLVGHSSGAQYVRIFAGRYPEAVAGVVLLDGQPAEAFEGLPFFPAFYKGYRPVSALFPSLARIGVGRLLIRADAGLPAQDRVTQRMHHTSPRLYRSQRDEFMELPTSLAEARSFQSLGARPLIVLTATQGVMEGWLPLQEQMAMLSTNSSHRLVPYTHDEVVTDRTGSQPSARAILDVVHAVRFASRLDPR